MITAFLMSMNDHNWGNRPNPNGKKGGDQGLPDLEELWRDLNRRLNGLFGDRRAGGPNKPNGSGGGNQNGEGLPPFNMRQFGGGIVFLLVLVVALWMASGIYIVDEGQSGVVLRFGRFERLTTPGPNMRLPWPIESHEIVNVSNVRTLEVGYRGSEKQKVLKEALMLTDDENIVSVQFAVQYLLKDPRNYLFNNRYPDDAVMGAAETAIREIVGKSKMDFVLYEGREQIAANSVKLIQEILDRYETGVQVRAVTMQSTQPPEQVQAAFDDAVKAGQDRERLKNEGQAYANDVIPRANGAASRLLQEAEGYKQRVIANADGEASRFKQVLVEYSKAPEVTRNRIYLETMQQVLSNTSKVMVDAKSGSNLLYLPLDKLMQAASAAPVGTVNPPAAEAATRPQMAATVSTESPPQLEKSPVVEQGSNVSSRTRESLRSRERGER